MKRYKQSKKRQNPKDNPRHAGRRQARELTGKVQMTR